jgi:hypothetical protein
MWTRLDQVFISKHSTDLIIACNTEPSKRGINSDHLPILTKLDLATTIIKESATHNFREVDWEEFNKELGKNLAVIEPAVTIRMQYQLNDSCNKLMTAIQTTISKVVLITRINAKSKHWWIKELTKLRRQADNLGRTASKLSHLPYHHLHAEHAAAVKLYHSTLKTTKRQHW